MKLVTKYQISAINSCWGKCDEKWAYTCMFNVYKNHQITWAQASYRYAILWEAFLDPLDSCFLFSDLVGFYTHFPRYGVPIWSLWPNIRFLPSIVAEENATKNEHICSMCRKINKVGKQEVGDDRNLIFGHKLHIGMPYCGKRFWTHQIPTSCLLT
jgi:hypothetical protein